MKSLLPLFVITVCIAFTGCSERVKPFTERRIIVGSKQTVKISELGLTITNNGCGRKWVSDGENPLYEKAYCDIVLEREGKTITAGKDSDPVYFGDLEIDIERMNPWGREEDSVPAGGCRLWVKRVGGR